MNEIGFKDVTSFLQVCGGARAKNALVIYLYKSSMGEEAPLHFDQPFAAGPAIHFYRFWLTNRLGFASAVAVLIFLVYWFATRPKREAKKAS
jgi:hypothetical protein